MSAGRDEQVPSVATVRRLADELIRAIRGGDLPAGTPLDPARLALLHRTSEAAVLEALGLLESSGEAELIEGRWRVPTGRQRLAREIMIRGEPALIAAARLAAVRATAAEVAGMREARERLVGITGDGRPEARARAYRDVMLQLGEASGSGFLLGAIGQLLREAAVMIDALARMDRLLNPAPKTDGELARLISAIADKDPEAAGQAIEDHVILISHQLDAVSRR